MAESKSLKKMKINSENFDARKKELIHNASLSLGLDVTKDYHVQSPNAYNNLDYNYFKDAYSQQMAIPFSQVQLDNFLNMKKTLVEPTQLIKVESVNGELLQVYCAYLKGTDPSTGKDVLFAFSITRPYSYYREGEYFKFGIKLDMLVGGKTEGAVNLMRFDSDGPKHANYIVDGKVVENDEDAQIVDTPHFHKNTEQNIVISSNKLDYTPAKAIDKEFVRMRDSQDKKFFKTIVKSFTDSAKMDVKYNNSEYYSYEYGRMLFEFDNFPKEKVGKGLGD